MAYKKDVIELARRFYVVEGKAIDEIAKVMRVPAKTVWNWRNKYQWDKEISDGGNVSLYLNMQKQFATAVQKAIDEGNLADPATADALWKTAKLMDRLMPEKMLLSNLFSFLEDMARYFANNVSDSDFIEKFQHHLPLLANYLRAKYTKD